MKELSPSFSMPPGESPHRYFRNAVLEFKKVLLSFPQDVDQLLISMEKLFNASRDMQWKESNTAVWKKEEGEKAMKKLFNEFKRYLSSMNTGSSNQKLLFDALDEIKRELDKFDIE
jgi:hypothetical protein